MPHPQIDITMTPPPACCVCAVRHYHLSLLCACCLQARRWCLMEVTARSLTAAGTSPRSALPLHLCVWTTRANAARSQRLVSPHPHLLPAHRSQIWARTATIHRASAVVVLQRTQSARTASALPRTPHPHQPQLLLQLLLAHPSPTWARTAICQRASAVVAAPRMPSARMESASPHILPAAGCSR